MLRGERGCLLARIDLVQEPDPALRLRYDLVRDHQDVGAREVLRGCRGDQRGEVIARPDGRERCERGGAEGAQAGAYATRTGEAPARSSCRSAPRVAGAWPRWSSSSELSAARSAGVSTSRARPPTSWTRCVTPARSAAATWRSQL